MAIARQRGSRWGRGPASPHDHVSVHWRGRTWDHGQLVQRSVCATACAGARRLVHFLYETRDPGERDHRQPAAHRMRGRRHVRYGKALDHRQDVTDGDLCGLLRHGSVRVRTGPRRSLPPYSNPSRTSRDLPDQCIAAARDRWLADRYGVRVGARLRGVSRASARDPGYQISPRPPRQLRLIGQPFP